MNMTRASTLVDTHVTAWPSRNSAKRRPARAGVTGAQLCFCYSCAPVRGHSDVRDRTAVRCDTCVLRGRSLRALESPPPTERARRTEPPTDTSCPASVCDGRGGRPTPRRCRWAPPPGRRTHGGY
jgi:hypothetical protein